MDSILDWFLYDCFFNRFLHNSFNLNCRPLWRFIQYVISFRTQLIILLFWSISRLSFYSHLILVLNSFSCFFLHPLSFLEFYAWINLDLIHSWFSINLHPSSLSRVCLIIDSSVTNFSPMDLFFSITPDLEFFALYWSLHPILPTLLQTIVLIHLAWLSHAYCNPSMKNSNINAQTQSISISILYHYTSITSSSSDLYLNYSDEDVASFQRGGLCYDGDLKLAYFPLKTPNYCPVRRPRRTLHSMLSP